MDNGNLAWLDYSVPARCFRNNIPCMKGVWQYKCRMASANILLVIINHLLYRFIARQASVVLVKVLILSCVSWPVCLSYRQWLFLRARITVKFYSIFTA